VEIPISGKSLDPFNEAEIILESGEVTPPFPLVLSSKDIVHGARIMQQAQELSTRTYLDKQYISADDLDDDGIYRDENTSRSVYFFAENSIRDSTCRYITADKTGIMSLPTAQNFAIDSEIVRKAAGVARISNLKSSEVIEVSALASAQHVEAVSRSKSRDELDATRLLYARVLRDSLDQGHKVWLLNTHEKLVRHLEIMLGKEQIHRLGETKEYMGSPTVPAAINPQEVVKSALRDETETGAMKREYLKETLKGVSDRYLDKEMLALLDVHDIPYERGSLLKRTLRHRKAMAYAAIAGYTVARAVPVANVEGFEGNAGIFFAIDFATAFPYTWGLVEAATAKKPVRRMIGGSVAAGSFAAPYVYFWAEGNDYPAWVNAAVGGIVGVSALMAANGIRKDKKLEAQLEADDDAHESVIDKN